MRTDVKLGVVVAMVVVSVAGGYYMYRDRAQQPILMGGQANAGSATKPKQPVKSDVAKNTLAKGSKRQRPSQRLKQPGSTGKAGSAKQASRGAARQNNAQNQAQNLSGRKPSQTSEAVRKARAKRAQQRLANRGSGGANRVGGEPVSRNARAASRQRTQDRNAFSKAKVAQSPTLPPVTQQRTARDASPKQQATTKRQVITKPVSLAAVAAASAAVEKHRVQPGDTLSSLAVQYYGSERHTRMLIHANKQLANPNRLKIGEIVNLPPAPKADQSHGASRGTNQRGKASSAGARTYTVQPGDSFYVIAKSRLGDASRWKELYELNRGVVGSDPAALSVGQVLALPR